MTQLPHVVLFVGCSYVAQALGFPYVGCSYAYWGCLLMIVCFKILVNNHLSLREFV